MMRSGKQPHPTTLLASAPELSGISGKYFVGRKMTASSKESYNREKAFELWETSAELVGLAQHI
jgi:hypothetical protein